MEAIKNSDAGAGGESGAGVIKGSSFRDYWYTDIREITGIRDMLEGSAERYAKNAAFWVKEKKGAPYKAVSYELLLHDVKCIGTALIEAGFAGGRIAVMGQNAYEWIVSYLSAMTAGSVVVPIDKELTAPEIANLLRAGGVSTIFCTRGECPKLDGIEEIENLIVMDFYGDRTDLDTPAPDDDDPDLLTWRKMLHDGEQLLIKGDSRFDEVKTDPDELAVILFTSGTTGNPKGVMLSQRNITTNIMDVCRICQVYETDKTLSILPIHHTYECTLGMLLVLYRGASTAFCEGFKYISQNMREAQNTFIIVVPRVLELVSGKIHKEIVKSGKEKTFRRVMKLNKALRKAGINLSRKIFRSILEGLGGKLRVVITGAAALDPNIIREFEDFGVMVLQGYGMTECTPLISGTPGSAPKERYRKAGSVGAVVDRGEIRIADPDGDGIGEVLFRGPNVMMGYYNMPEETKQVIEEDGFMHTGDLGFVDPEGWLYLTGRKKNVIVTKLGENIYPEEIEDEILREPTIEDCIVFPYKVSGEETVAIQILPNAEELREALGHDPDERETLAHFQSLVREFNDGLPIFKRIRSVFVRREDFVRTTTRKIKRQDNPVSQETMYWDD